MKFEMFFFSVHFKEFHPTYDPWLSSLLQKAVKSLLTLKLFFRLIIIPTIASLPIHFAQYFAQSHSSGTPPHSHRSCACQQNEFSLSLVSPYKTVNCPDVMPNEGQVSTWKTYEIKMKCSFESICSFACMQLCMDHDKRVCCILCFELFAMAMLKGTDSVFSYECVSLERIDSLYSLILHTQTYPYYQQPLVQFLAEQNSKCLP